MTRSNCHHSISNDALAVGEKKQWRRRKRKEELGRSLPEDEIGWQSHHRFSLFSFFPALKREKSPEIRPRNERGKRRKRERERERERGGDLEGKKKEEEERSNWKSCQDWGVEKRFVCTAGLRGKGRGRDVISPPLRSALLFFV